jgi:hypothetical protein
LGPAKKTGANCHIFQKRLYFQRNSNIGELYFQLEAPFAEVKGIRNANL